VDSAVADLLEASHEIVAGVLCNCCDDQHG